MSEASGSNSMRAKLPVTPGCFDFGPNHRRAYRNRVVGIEGKITLQPLSFGFSVQVEDEDVQQFVWQNQVRSYVAPVYHVS
jgi:hypothetical protein